MYDLQQSFACYQAGLSDYLIADGIAQRILTLRVTPQQNPATLAQAARASLTRFCPAQHWRLIQAHFAAYANTPTWAGQAIDLYRAGGPIVSNRALAQAATPSRVEHLLRHCGVYAHRTDLPDGQD